MRNPLLLFVIPAALVLAAPAARADDAASLPAELFLAGGALHVCSDLAPRDCGSRPGDDAVRRGAARYRFDADAPARASAEGLWPAADGAPTPGLVAGLVRAAANVAGDATLDGDGARAAFAAICIDATNGVAGTDCGAESLRPWDRLLDDERGALLAAIELAQRDAGGARLRERAYPEHSRDPHGVAVLRAFVASAALRAPGRRPRIAVVTASAYDPFDPVDMYLDLFTRLGADARWWPVDAALNAAVHGSGCDALDLERRRQLRLPGREGVYPDLAAAQAAACADAAALAALPGEVDAVFFSGGDQWRLRRAFVDADDRPNAWLRALRAAHASGRLVVGGTSAGTAVQAGRDMVSNGDSATALRTGAQAMAPLEPGCGPARRCPGGRDEATLTFWPAGGLGLAGDWTVDTHFSERARELRLLRLLHDGGATVGLGVDETSALHLSRRGDAVQVEALGASGGWLFQRQAAADGALAARVHYLAPGRRFEFAGGELRPLGEAALSPRLGGLGPALPASALDDGALRDAARVIAASGRARVRLPAGDGEAVLEREPGAGAWRDDGRVGITGLRLRWQPDLPPRP